MPPPLPPRRSGFDRRRLLSLLGAAAIAACGIQEDWSPLDGPWDPDHPDAAAVLEAPEPGSPVDHALADAGERWYRVRGCLACHRLDGHVAVGPPLDGITHRREYDWYRGMVMRPDSMLMHDPRAQELLRIYGVPMPDQGVDELRTRAMWEFHRRLDGDDAVPTGPQGQALPAPSAPLPAGTPPP